LDTSPRKEKCDLRLLDVGLGGGGGNAKSQVFAKREAMPKLFWGVRKSFSTPRVNNRSAGAIRHTEKGKIRRKKKPLETTTSKKAGCSHRSKKHHARIESETKRKRPTCIISLPMKEKKGREGLHLPLEVQNEPSRHKKGGDRVIRNVHLRE